ncbi:MAG: sigma factor-like helix-turn-helix DNA-binding protein, partial [Polyangiaceae bacterium]
LQELGDRLGVSKERVRQIEERARAKLRVLLEDMEGEAA